MSRLTPEERDKLPDSDFALPGRKYPIHDYNHAVAAMRDVSMNGTPEEKALVRRKVREKYSIG